MVNFKAFVDFMGIMDRDEAQTRYDEYKQEFEKKHAEIFFEMHCEDQWFKERYDPEMIYRQ
jgi:SERRATE/Ars2, N-terminal domain